MSGSATQSEDRRGFVPQAALAVSIEFTEDTMWVHLRDGRIVGVPLAWFPALQAATPAQREGWEIGGGGVSVHWEAIDEDICVANLLAGADWTST